MVNNKKSYYILKNTEFTKTADTRMGKIRRPNKVTRATKIVLTKKTVAFNSGNRIMNPPYYIYIRIH